MFICEFIVVIVVILVILSVFIFTKFLSLPFFTQIRNLFPRLFSQSSNYLVSGIFYLLLFICTTFVYKVASGTNPKTNICLFYAFLSTISVFFLSYILNIFMNFENYNIIYGTISTMLILMIKVYFFFIIFLFCAQMLYVSQFFHQLLKGEIYLLPENYQDSVKDAIRRAMFIDPFLLLTEENTLKLEKDSVLYAKDSVSNMVYYLYEGIIEENDEVPSNRYVSGSFIGDIETLTHKNHKGTAIAKTDCILMKITPEEFKNLMHENPLASTKALKKLSSHL